MSPTTKTDAELMNELYAAAGVDPHAWRGDDSVARIEIHGNAIVGVNEVPGFEVEGVETEEGVDARIRVTAGTVIEKPVQVCFGLMPASGVQKLNLDIRLEENARAGVYAVCAFPFAEDIRHEMDATIDVGPGAEYAYYERHIHGEDGGVFVKPHSKVQLGEGARFATDFELIKGRVGEIDIDVEAVCAARSTLDVKARVKGVADDRIRINERGHLAGAGARGVLVSNIALKDRADALVENTLRATAPGARGHVDCKEIVRGEAVARAVPIVEVLHPQAHVTHEAAIGSVDSKQLQTLMSRGLTEDEAVDLIIEGLLS